MKKIIKTCLKKILSTAVYRSLIQFRRGCYRLLKWKKKIDTKYEVKSVGSPGYDTFFGYYDVSPFNEKNELLFLEIPKEESVANIVLMNTEDSHKRIVATSKAWNWQQGSRLRWYPGSNDLILFNDYVDDAFVTRIINVRTREERVLPSPTYDINNKGDLFLSLNFERLGVKRPGYGYVLKPYSEQADLSDEGISIIDVASGKPVDFVGYREIATALGIEVKDYSPYYINHLSFCPDGSKFLFFWLEITPAKHKASLLVHDLKAHKITVLESGLKVSHYVWIDNRAIVCTAYDDDFNCCYYKYGMAGEKVTLLPSVLNRDGHPSILAPHLLLTDTYPDRYGYQQIYVVDLLADKGIPLIDIIAAPVEKEERRTDLHPRLNKDKTQLCFDANVDGYRKIYLLKGWRNLFN